jgi:hypothetical protein
MKIAAAALALSIFAAPTFAADAGNVAITAIGEINGIALACNQPAIVSRARNAVTTTAPKTRAYGEAFEAATNAAYLAQGKGATCPDVATLVKRLNDAEKSLSTAFASQ